MKLFVTFGITQIFAVVAVFAELAALESELPWLTGPLIAPPGETVPYEDFLIKSILFGGEKECPSFASDTVYGLIYQGKYYFGITSFCDVNVIINSFFNTTEGQCGGNVGDVIAGFDFQLLKSDYTPYFPGIKFAIREIFPTGKFEYLRPRKYMTDLTGMGTFSTQFALIFYKIFHLPRDHWLSLTLSAEYMLSSPVEVHDFNAYGGGFGTKGMLLRGDVFQAMISFEFTLSRNWALALDTLYTHFQETQFFGLDGITFEGMIAPMGLPNGRQVGFCPSIEWNLSPHFGIIAGYYFSAFSHNCREFRYGAINFNYFY